MQEGDLVQVAHVVWDIDKTMKQYWEKMGVGPWDVYTFAPPELRESKVRGNPSDHVFQLSVTWRNDVQFELMQPVSGRSIYDEFLEEKGEGLHHIKLYYSDCQKALEEFARRGIEPIQSGKFGDDEYYYLNTEPTMGIIVEIGNAGEIREPDRRYPE